MVGQEVCKDTCNHNICQVGELEIVEVIKFIVSCWLTNDAINAISRRDCPKNQFRELVGASPYSIHHRPLSPLTQQMKCLTIVKTIFHSECPASTSFFTSIRILQQQIMTVFKTRSALTAPLSVSKETDKRKKMVQTTGIQNASKKTTEFEHHKKYSKIIHKKCQQTIHAAITDTYWVKLSAILNSRRTEDPDTDKARGTVPSNRRSTYPQISWNDIWIGRRIDEHTIFNTWNSDRLLIAENR